MSTPVIERIATEIRRRLNRAATSIGQTTLTRPGRTVPSGFSVVVQQTASRPLPKLDYPGNPPAKCFECVFDIECFIDHKTNEAEYAAACNAVVGYVVSAITLPEVSPQSWYTFGGFAVLADLGQSRDVPTEVGSFGMVAIPLTVQYRVSENDHSQVR